MTGNVTKLNKSILSSCTRSVQSFIKKKRTFLTLNAFFQFVFLYLIVFDTNNFHFIVSFYILFTNFDFFLVGEGVEVSLIKKFRQFYY